MGARLGATAGAQKSHRVEIQSKVERQITADAKDGRRL